MLKFGVRAGHVPMESMAQQRLLAACMLSSSSSTNIHNSSFAMLESRFKQYVGVHAVEQLRAKINHRRVITIGGDQLTGKSTLGKKLAQVIGADYIAAGSIFRSLAEKKGITVAQLSRQAKNHPEIDVQIEYMLCELIAAGAKPATQDKNEHKNEHKTNHQQHHHQPLIIEGRQPAVMAAYMRHLGKKNCVCVYLHCSFRDQGLRFLQREVSNEIFERVAKELPELPYRSLAEVSKELQKLDLPGLSRISQMFTDNEHRDNDDRHRYSLLYGFGPALDYRNKGLYDIITDTSQLNSVDRAFQATLSELAQFGVIAEHAIHPKPKL